jgi:beta-galactosidase
MTGFASSRRALLRAGAGGAALAGLSGCTGSRSPAAPDARRTGGHDLRQLGTYQLNQRWLFGGRYATGCTRPGYDDTGFAEVTLPHTVTPLSWRGWDPASWQHTWIYRRHITCSARLGGRVFVDFDGVMTDALVLLNGHQVAAHRGGYLPWSAELTAGLVPGGNVLAVVVDGRWLPVPPDGAARGARAVDYLQPAGIYRDVRLRVVPSAFLADLYAKPVVTADGWRVEVACTVDAAGPPPGPMTITAELLDDGGRLAAARATAAVTVPGRAVTELSLPPLADVGLWSPRAPRLYTVRATLRGTAGAAPRPAAGSPVHYAAVRIGFRTARFEIDGFYLNGERVQIFGLNRHQLFPYTGMAMAARLQRRDAEILRNELNCNMVRCSHYPPDPHFLDACDELGLMVWEEAPGWHHIGGPAWQDLAVGCVRDMVIRDRSRPSVIVWGTRLNETADSPGLYRRTRRAARELDGTRQSSGAMRTHSTAGWAEDVFAYDDYHHVGATGEAALLPPLPRVPYLVTEAVGALDGLRFFRWTDPPEVLGRQALMHATVHDIARSSPRYAGLLGWAGFDYASLNGHEWDAVKWPGVADTFRVPKPGAAIYRSQVDPARRPVILPVFPWDAYPGSPLTGHRATWMIATNCDLLQIYVGGRHAATGTPDRARLRHLDYPPVLLDLAASPALTAALGGPALPDLRIDGYSGGQLVARVSMAADTSADRLALTVEDEVIVADGSDATRVTFRAVDAYGNQRRHVTGTVSLSLTGPALLVGDNPFAFGAYGGLGGAFIRSLPGATGPVTMTAAHQALGEATAQVRVVPPGPGLQFL